MVRLPMSKLAAGERLLDAAQSRYLLKVHRMVVGDRFMAFDGAAKLEADGTIEPERWVRLGEPRPARVTARSITWIHALPKADKADAIVRDATELGATRIVFVATERSVPKPKTERTTRWVRIAEQAARQCGRGDLPSVAVAPAWNEALETDAETRVCLVPSGKPLRDVLMTAHGPLSFAAGPEGGLTQAEIEAALARRYIAASAGSLVLRTETVPAAVLGAVAILL